jgi:hypothetical protein
MVIVIEFVDGPLGESLVFCEDRASFEGILARGIYELTDRGTVGSIFQIVSPAALESIRLGKDRMGDEADLHLYQIAERFEVDERFTIRATYIPRPRYSQDS